jgi:CRP/FNR family transcriptional regulator
MDSLVELYPVLAELPGGLRDRVLASLKAVTVPAATTLFDERQPCQGFPRLPARPCRLQRPGHHGIGDHPGAAAASPVR